jgi:hypothetical protein
LKLREVRSELQDRLPVAVDQPGDAYTRGIWAAAASSLMTSVILYSQLVDDERDL